MVSRCLCLVSVSMALSLSLAACTKPDDAGRPGEGEGTAVLVVQVRQQDVPVERLGLGTASGFYTATVRARVDGMLDRVLFQEGETVRRGQLLAELDARPFRIALQQAEAGLSRDRAQLTNARLNLERNMHLRDDHLVSGQVVDDLAASAAQLAATVQSDEAGVASARLQLAYCRIVAPIDGRTGIRQMDPGNLARAADANGLVLVTQMDPMAVIFTLPEADLAAVVRAQAGARLPVEALSRDGTEVLAAGSLALIDNQINATSGTLRLKAVLPNAAGLLWPNQYVKVRLRLHTLVGASVLPAAALQRGPEGTFVYVVDGDSLAQVRPVTVQMTVEELAVIDHGLSPGETVVLEGQHRLKPGDKVRARPAPSGLQPPSPEAPPAAAP